MSEHPSGRDDLAWDSKPQLNFRLGAKDWWGRGVRAGAHEVSRAMVSVRMVEIKSSTHCNWKPFAMAVWDSGFVSVLSSLSSIKKNPTFRVGLMAEAFGF